jgi:hypothetical protein
MDANSSVIQYGAFCAQNALSCILFVVMQNGIIEPNWPDYTNSADGAELQ